MIGASFVIAILLAAAPANSTSDGTGTPLSASAPAVGSPSALWDVALDAAEGELASLDGGLAAQQRRNIDAARSLLGIEGRLGSDERGSAIARAQAATNWQADAVGIAWVPAAPVAAHRTPSEALLALAQAHGAQPTADVLGQMRSLDLLEDPVRSALARFVDAFLALDAAGREVFGQPGTAAAPDSMASILPVRSAFLESVEELASALEDPATPRSHSATKLPPVFSIDLAADSDTFPESEVFALVLDAGGDDTYLSNAGGNNLGTPGTCPDALNGVLNFPAAALVDLGAGTDQFGSTANPRRCGANGGGRLGVGFLFDGGGNDLYAADSGGVNGGGFEGLGFLLDVAGHDTFQSAGLGGGAGSGANGGARRGLGLLIDGGGDDAFDSGPFGANGGALDEGVGFLLDAGGNDAYSGTSNGVNGGGNRGSVGFLLDVAGHDSYFAGEQATNGGAFDDGALLQTGGVPASGFLFDGDGDDVFNARCCGTNGGALVNSRGASGLLINVGGVDSYRALQPGNDGAASEGVNGGVNGGVGVGFALLLDVGCFGDTYGEDTPGAGDPMTVTTDTSTLTKGILGNQLDLLSGQCT